MKRCHPLVGIMLTLSNYISDSHWSTKVTLKPIQMIVVPCAPDPHEATALALAQFLVPGAVKVILFG